MQSSSVKASSRRWRGGPCGSMWAIVIAGAVCTPIYRGRNASPGYHCPGKILVENRGVYCLNIGGIQIDEAVTRTFITALEPAGLATLAAAEWLEAEREAALKQWRLGVERANYEAQRAERRCRAVDPDNRLVARGLERDWEERLRALETAKIELKRREKERPRVISEAERDRLLALGPDLAAVWNAPTTTPRDRKELLRTLIEDVTIKVDRDKAAAHLALRWKGGALAAGYRPHRRGRDRAAAPARGPLPRQCDRRHPQSAGAGHGIRFTAGRVGNLRRHWGIPCFEPRACAPEGELLTIKKAAVVLGVAPSTIHRLLNDGIIAGEQPTPGAPWRIRLTKDLKDRFNGECRRRLPADAGGDARARRLAPDRVAACKARRTRRRPCHARQTVQLGSFEFMVDRCRVRRCYYYSAS
jgi:hypothetical protein